MTSFLDEIKKKQTILKETKTVITTKDGKKFVEKKELDGTTTLTESEDKSAGYVIDTKPDPNLHFIIDGLFLGSQDAAVNLEGLKTNNVTHLLNVATGVSIQNAHLFNYRNVEILDLEETSIISYFDRCFEFIDNALKQGEGVLVFCNAGVSRSASVVIGYLMKTRRHSYEGAYQLVKASRPSIQPNRGFVIQLKSYEGILNSK
eukprot:TRINITY_DN5709_c0_g1_i1.p1 TRINITY_DN5709_c0_g1~~TRINITY_DN5709_c0_g1_i1.p1  ORF type:complete len:204 (-),score=36.07 TRINITY_DN5709_c0_g1_i1:363-974(-)